MYYIGIDLGGTNIAAGVVDETFHIVKKGSVPTGAHRTADERRRSRRVVDLWLEPKMPEVSQYKMKYHDSAYDAGYALGKENAAKIAELLKD